MDGWMDGWMDVLSKNVYQAKAVKDIVKLIHLGKIQLGTRTHPTMTKVT